MTVTDDPSEKIDADTGHTRAHRRSRSMSNDKFNASRSAYADFLATDEIRWTTRSAWYQYTDLNSRNILLYILSGDLGPVGGVPNPKLKPFQVARH